MGIESNIHNLETCRQFLQALRDQVEPADAPVDREAMKRSLLEFGVLIPITMATPGASKEEVALGRSMFGEKNRIMREVLAEAATVIDDLIARNRAAA